MLLWLVQTHLIEVGMETCEVLDFNKSAKVVYSKPSSAGSSV